ncbi:diguanylate cyclase (GGDEF) domain-containing protein [Halobacillus aidingensis]|uniref:Diguanylate cyclase (GGDEF) domain-containing protein n=2 Tax=Halobacillus aidingensis TaxID=240303 RepID=A0A1H0I9G6_HALAD|nr:diguanylate cyclase (GGDEF) domain-containing protein [Halobacillus aidingensis]
MKMEGFIPWTKLNHTYAQALHTIIPKVIEDHLLDMSHIKEFRSYVEHYPDYSSHLSQTLHRSCDALFLPEKEYERYIEKDYEEGVHVGIAFAKRNYFTIDLMLHLTHSTRMCSIQRVLKAIKDVETVIDSSPIIERFFDITNKRQNSFFKGYINEQNKKLKHQSIRDPLTSLYNRRYFYPYVKEELVRAQKEGFPITLVLVDFNNFKEINDRRGHQEGDRVLKRFARCLSNIHEGFDGAFRFGGDEFVLVLSACSEDTAEKLAQNLNETIKQIEKGASISYGLIQLPADSFIEGLNLDMYLNLADKRMYENKQYTKKIKTPE